MSQLQKVRDLIAAHPGQFGSYQSLPPCVTEALPDDLGFDYQPNQILLDRHAPKDGRSGISGNLARMTKMLSATGDVTSPILTTTISLNPNGS